MDWSLAVSIGNDEEVLKSTLLRSPALQKARQVLCQRNFASVALAYNAAIRECPKDVLVFTHPDVYLPAGWPASLERSLDWLNRNDPQWGVAGLVGCTKDGAIRGFAFSTGQGAFIGRPLAAPCEVRTLDEFVFMLRPETGLNFDEAIPGPQCQLCTTDLCLQAAQANMRSYAMSCFALHNSNRWDFLPLRFWGPYLYMRKKWRRALPVQVPYTHITPGCLPMVKNTLRGFLQGGGRSHRVVTRVADPASFYEQLQRDVLSVMS